MKSLRIRPKQSQTSRKSNVKSSCVRADNHFNTIMIHTQTQTTGFITLQKRFFGFEIPSTLRRYKQGQTIDIDQIPMETIDEAIRDVNYHLNAITEDLESYDHHAHTMSSVRSSAATQLAYSAILMNMGLQKKAKEAKEALEKLKTEKSKPRIQRNPETIQACKSVLEHYYEDNKFTFDFRPPYEFISTA